MERIIQTRDCGKFLFLFAACTSLGWAPQALEGHQQAPSEIKLKVLLDILPGDYSIFDAKETADACTEFLEGSKELPKTHLVKLLVKRGDAMRKLGKPEVALKDFERALEFSDLPEVRIKKVAALGQLGRVSDAKKQCAQLIKDFPKYAPGYAFFSTISIGGKRFEDALDAADKALAIDPNNVRALVCRAMIWHEKNNPAACVADINMALRIDPLADHCLEIHNIYIMRGANLALLEKFDAALKDFQMARLANPKTPQIDLGIWEIYSRQGKKEAALVLIRRLVAENPNSSSFRACEALTLEQVGDMDGVMKSALKALELDSKNELGHCMAGVGYAYLGKFRNASDSFKTAIRLNPTLYYTNCSYSEFLSSCPEKEFRDGTKAVELATKACELTYGDDANAWLVLANARAELGQFDKALALLEKAEKIAVKHVSRGDVAQRVGVLRSLYLSKRVYRTKTKK